MPVDGLAAPEAYLAPRASKERPASERPPSERPADSRSDVVPAASESLPATGVDVGWLRSTLQKALQATGPERRELVESLSQAFGRIGPAGESGRQMADYLLAQLEAGHLAGLVDSHGRSLRARAVEAVLALGYPFALEVSPEDLEHLRRDSTSGAALTPMSVAAILVAVGGAAVTLTQTAGFARFWEAGAEAALAIVGVLMAALSRAGTRTAQMGMALLVVSAALGVWLMRNGMHESLLAVLGAVLAGLLLFRRE